MGRNIYIFLQSVHASSGVVGGVRAERALIKRGNEIKGA